MIALAHLADRPEQFVSAREIAQAHSLPVALLMKLLKSLHHCGIVRSVRGVNGGYQLQADLRVISLQDLLQVLNSAKITEDSPVAPADSPLTALRYKVQRFVREIKLSDLVLPGRRIDVPVELVGIEKCRSAALAGLSA